MRFGLCCGLDQARAALDSGFDYVELPAYELIEKEGEYAELRPEATNLFFPSTMRLLGPDQTPFLDYARQTIEAASRVGVQTMVVGSGGARKAPDGMEKDQAESAFARVCYELAEIAHPLGITIAPESLNRAETNVGNHLRELSTELRDLGVGYTADSYHVLAEWVFEGNEAPPDRDYWIDQMPFLPAHVHLASRDRFDPSSSDPDLEGFVHRLNELGYDGRVSLECKRRGDQELAQALAEARELFRLHTS